MGNRGRDLMAVLALSEGGGRGNLGPKSPGPAAPLHTEIFPAGDLEGAHRAVEFIPPPAKWLDKVLPVARL